jgi:hypothetical protein
LIHKGFLNTNTAVTRQLLRTDRMLEAERRQVLRGSMGTGIKEDKSSTGRVWAAGFHHVAAVLAFTNAQKGYRGLFQDATSPSVVWILRTSTVIARLVSDRSKSNRVPQSYHYTKRPEVTYILSLTMSLITGRHYVATLLGAMFQAGGRPFAPVLTTEVRD